MSKEELTIRDRLEDILESIELIQEWSKGMTELKDFMTSPNRVMAFNACVMRLQVIGEHVGKLLKEKSKPLDAYSDIPWHAIYGMRNLISHEYGNIDEVIVVSTINDDLPKLKAVIEEMLCKPNNNV
ncbi:MAG: DUF86 domain-containing protein [Prevotella sp.]|nr:DUF86 domain-containing protein [Prevotella sp.]